MGNNTSHTCEDDISSSDWRLHRSGSDFLNGFMGWVVRKRVFLRTALTEQHEVRTVLGVQVLERRERKEITRSWELSLDYLMEHYHPLSPNAIKTYTDAKNLVFILEGCAYNATPWLNKHPGGKYILFKFAGRDATSDFKRIHGRRARELVKQCLIGPVYVHRPLRQVEDEDSERLARSLVESLSTNPMSSYASNSSSLSYFDDADLLTARVLRVFMLNPRVKEITFTQPEDPISGGPGAYIQIHYGQMQREYTLVNVHRRCFSIAVRLYDRDGVSRYLHNLYPGEAVRFSRPCTPQLPHIKETLSPSILSSVSDTLSTEPAYRGALLIAQGMGLVVQMAVAAAIDAKRVILVTCWHSVTDAFYLDKLRHLPENVSCVFFISTGINADPPLKLKETRVCPETLSVDDGHDAEKEISQQKNTDQCSSMALPSIVVSTTSSTQTSMSNSTTSSGGGGMNSTVTSQFPGIIIPYRLSGKKLEELVGDAGNIDVCLVCGSEKFEDDVQHMLKNISGAYTNVEKEIYLL